MQRLIIITTLILFAGVSLAVMGEGSNSTYNSSVTSREVVVAGPNTIVLNGDATGGLPGAYHILIRYNAETKEIIGGDWVRTIVQVEPDSEPTEIGTLHGDVTGGSISISENGKVIAVNAATLTIAGGNKGYGGVNSGSGVFDGSIQPEGDAPAPLHAPPPSAESSQASAASAQSQPGNAGARPVFSGTMKLNF